MPAKSKAQFRFMEGISHGMTPKSGKGPSKEVAKEFIEATAKPRNLPERKTPKK